MSTPPWWRDAVIYQVYIRSFADGNGDGVGDIAGIRSRLPYLKSLGVDALWINPWYKSPMADHGYDVADYREIDPLFGTVAEAEQLIDEAHALGIRIVPDIVPNHSSDQHAWFQAALAAGPGSPERERYIFRPGRGPDGALPPNGWDSRFGGPAWTRVADGEWYLHLFTPQQPDVNWQHPDVHAEFESVLRFWFDRGVDGFRIDVAHGLVKDPELPEVSEGVVHPFWDRDEVHDIYRAWRRLADEYPGDRAFVAEAWTDTPERLAAYVRPDVLHTAFNFDFLMTDWDAKDLRAVIDDTLATLGAVGAPATWVLSNHDVMRHASRYGRKAARKWVANESYVPAGPADLALGTRRARAAALLTLALPGGAYVYQGEELGLPEVEDLPEGVLQDPVWERSGHTERGRDGCRVPIPWSGSGTPYGFSPAGAAAPWLPQPDDWAPRTVAAQSGDADSMLELYRAALRIRREQPALGDGELTWLDDTVPAGVLAFRREPGFVCVVNLSGEPHELPEHAEILLTSGPIEGDALAPDQAVWLAV
ncbi:glycoside hydrolase family 13 protein [Streptomyces acidiscabies]|uniref:Glycoside hydrolase family 13 protein n=1 Tax=Streptomyces acidiscabies TaxID=42234 RepID=A0AAP6EI71_9ACTN|nr:glycoside hydrolase family 13 protein [Streptomyces acidiscabies]MBZ3913405.1 glycoside hydrolase family 13 protein [Streptomyces acidiscabies]MDX2963170.1 glycoside hydrolase family 13 protein [Streptomyces acidiscabies]MDX3024379.1 glycoside hydrolase family 13 protein [Streptomyces acidiscabies]MDX3795223.1 glycoside hydrolase family 13 protein [Streptomyces acidiscabies]GAQ53291.1 oligo-1,6-glucosidase [Streptomyces acidiscabies]